MDCAKRGSQQRHALTLLEVIVLMAIAGVLFALLLPAIRKVRSLDESVRCAAKLKKLGEAAYQYHDKHRMLPPGELGPKPNGGYFGGPPPVYNDPSVFQQVGSLVFLLPYIDEGPLYERLVVNMDLNYPPDGGLPATAYWTRAENWNAAQVQLEHFQCPSDAKLNERVSNGVALFQHHYGAMTWMWYGASHDQRPTGRSNYAGVAGALGKDASTKDPNSCSGDPGGGANLAKYEGLLTNRSRNALTRVPDGLSNTMLFGEGIGGNIQSGNPRDWAWSWIGVGMVATKFGLGQPGYPYGNSLLGSSWTNFSSFHANGCNFCFADGSVRMIRFGATTQRTPNCSNDWYILQALAGFRDGQVR